MMNYEDDLEELLARVNHDTKENGKDVFVKVKHRQVNGKWIIVDYDFITNYDSGDGENVLNGGDLIDLRIQNKEYALATTLDTLKCELLRQKDTIEYFYFSKEKTMKMN